MDHHHIQRIKIKFNSICDSLVRFYIKYLCMLLNYGYSKNVYNNRHYIFFWPIKPNFNQNIMCNFFFQNKLDIKGYCVISPHIKICPRRRGGYDCITTLISCITCINKVIMFL